MQYIVVGLVAPITIVCYALSYLWYHSDRETDRRLERRQDYLAAARRDFPDGQVSNKRAHSQPYRAHDARIEWEVGA